MPMDWRTEAENVASLSGGHHSAVEERDALMRAAAREAPGAASWAKRRTQRLRNERSHVCEVSTGMGQINGCQKLAEGRVGSGCG